jgi:hypothetical protein
LPTRAIVSSKRRIAGERPTTRDRGFPASQAGLTRGSRRDSNERQGANNLHLTRDIGWSRSAAT